MDRRGFIQAGLAVPFVSLAELAHAIPAVTAAQASIPNQVQMVTADRRFVASVAFAQALHRHGSVSREYEGDLTGLWLSHVQPLWRSHRGTTAGVSNLSALFCLEMFARDHGMRVVARRDLFPAERENLISAMPDPVSAANRSWVYTLDHMLSVSAGLSRRPINEVISGPANERLVAWIIAATDLI